MHKCRSGLLLLCLFSSPVFSAEEAAELPLEKELEEEPRGLVNKATVYVDGAQRKASEKFGAFMTRVDGFFSDAATNDEALGNTSWARIRLESRHLPGGAYEFKPSLKVRVSLPNTERRFKLLLSTEDDDTSAVGESVERTESVSDRDRSASAAIRFIRSARKDGNADVDIGVRRRQGEIQYFARMSVGYRKILAKLWEFSASNSYWHYNKSGFENRFSFDFRRELFSQENFYFRSYSEINWRKGQQGAVMGQTFGLYTFYGSRKSLALEAISGYHTSESDEIKERYRGSEVRFRWRHNVWRPWFFYEVWPSVSWPAAADYRQSYGLLLRVEMVIE